MKPEKRFHDFYPLRADVVADFIRQPVSRQCRLFLRNRFHVLGVSCRQYEVVLVAMNVVHGLFHFAGGQALPFVSPVE